MEQAGRRPAPSDVSAQMWSLIRRSSLGSPRVVRLSRATARSTRQQILSSSRTLKNQRMRDSGSADT